MNDPQTSFITWQMLAVTLLTVLQAIVAAIAVWAIKLLLVLAKNVQRTSARVAHVENHLELRDEGAFKPLEVEA